MFYRIALSICLIGTFSVSTYAKPYTERLRSSEELVEQIKEISSNLKSLLKKAVNQHNLLKVDASDISKSAEEKGTVLDEIQQDVSEIRADVSDIKEKLDPFISEEMDDEYLTKEASEDKPSKDKFLKDQDVEDAARDVVKVGNKTNSEHSVDIEDRNMNDSESDDFEKADQKNKEKKDGKGDQSKKSSKIARSTEKAKKSKGKKSEKDAEEE